MSRRNLVLAAVGDGSLHRRWQRGATSFDSFLVYYGDDDADRFAGDADHYLRLRGQKWHLVDHALSERGDVIGAYDAVWIPDDDLDISGHDVDALFDVFHRYELRLAQPAVALGRHVSHAICAEQPGLLLRYTRFVEIQAPLFSREALRMVAPTFVESRSGWGLDLVWPRLLGDGGIAIVDAYPVAHTRPLRSVNAASEEDVAALARRYGIGLGGALFEVTGSVTLDEVGLASLGRRRRARAAAYRTARSVLGPAVRLLRG